VNGWARSIAGIHWRWAVDCQVDRQDGVAVPVNMGKLIQAGLVHDRGGVIGCNRPHVIVESCVCKAKYGFPAFDGNTSVWRG
jgi:hypothetical protein